MTITGYIQDYDGQALTIVAPFSTDYILVKQGITECEVRLIDGRKISPLQRIKVHALIGDITGYLTGYYTTKTQKERRLFQETLNEMQLAYLFDVSDCEEVRRQLTANYCMLQKIDLFSLAERGSESIDMSTVRDFIDWLVEFCIRFGVPCRDTLLNRCEDTGRYLYACLIHKTCCICGKKSELHHAHAVGMGRNRKEIIHLGMEVMPLCRTHHTEAHTMGQIAFNGRYKVYGIKVDKEISDVYRLKGV